jgi:hypothetical protein
MAPGKVDLAYRGSGTIESCHIAWARQRKRYKWRLWRGGIVALLIHKVASPPKQQAWLNAMATRDR